MLNSSQTKKNEHHMLADILSPDLSCIILVLTFYAIPIGSCNKVNLGMNTSTIQ